MITLWLSGCNNAPTGPQQTTKYLSHPVQVETDMEGAVLMVDNGIMVLVQNGPMKAIPTILIPANDSAGMVLKGYYRNSLENGYQTMQMPWVKVAGNFIREDSLSPIFKYSWVELMDHSSEIKDLEQMEE